jgi:hypothetical protein
VTCFKIVDVDSEPRMLGLFTGFAASHLTRRDGMFLARGSSDASRMRNEETWLQRVWSAKRLNPQRVVGQQHCADVSKQV